MKEKLMVLISILISSYLLPTGICLFEGLVAVDT